MGLMMKLWASLDRFTVGLVLAIALSIVLPCRGIWDDVFSAASDGAIVLLFFLYGAKLSRKAVVEGLTHWRLQGLVVLCTFVAFPLIGLALALLFGSVLGPELTMGLLYVCMLPSTVQSSIAFTSIARGNVAAAICAASLSSLLGVFVTPLLVGLFVVGGGMTGGLDWGVFGNICLIILVPFVAGQLLQRFIGEWVRNHRNVTSWTDQATVWLVVYTAFSHSMNEGVWSRLPVLSLWWVLVASAVLLALAMAVTFVSSRLLKFSREDRIAIIFCGSKKSLATGVPMMKVIFAGTPMGLLVIPLMVFHQLQLVVCAWLAKRWSREPIR